MRVIFEVLTAIELLEIKEGMALREPEQHMNDNKDSGAIARRTKLLAYKS